MSGDELIEVTLEQTGPYEFRVRFDGTAIPDLVTDENPPLGADAGPNPSRMLAVSVANCLSASLLFALRKYKNHPEKLVATSRTTVSRNEHGRLRITHVAVDIQLGEVAAALMQADRAFAQFEDFCVVTESVRRGIPVQINVRDVNGAIVHTGNA